MASKHDAPCSGPCGRILPGTVNSLPAGERMCRPCRAALPRESKWSGEAERCRAYRERLGDTYRARAREREYEYVHGISRDERGNLIAFQGGTCPLSGADLTSIRGEQMATDHAHWVIGSEPRGRKNYRRSPLAVRGILTREANLRLGKVEPLLLAGVRPDGMDDDTYARYLRYITDPPAAAWRRATWTPERWSQAVDRHQDVTAQNLAWEDHE